MEPTPTIPPIPTSTSGDLTAPWHLVWSIPWVIQALAVIFIVIIVAQAAPRILGPYQKALEAWIDGRRRTRTASKDADVTALRQQVDEVQAVLQETQRELRDFRSETRYYQRLHDEILGVHAEWDRRMIQALATLGGRPMPVPPLWPDQRPDLRVEPPGDGDADEAYTHP